MTPASAATIVTGVSAPIGMLLATFVNDVFTRQLDSIAADPSMSWRVVFITGLIPAGVASTAAVPSTTSMPSLPPSPSSSRASNRPSNPATPDAIISTATTDNTATSGRASWAARVPSVGAGAPLCEPVIGTLTTAETSPSSCSAPSAASNSARVWKRCSTSRAIARSITNSTASGISGAIDRGRFGSLVSTAVSVAAGSSASNGSCPVKHRYRIAPTE